MLKRLQSDVAKVVLLATAASLAGFFYFCHANELLLYGDAVAHINIARRVVDSLTPGPQQLGTVWLPLPHLLMLPLVWVDFLWQNGFAGSLVSMIAFVLGSWGIFRLVLPLTSREGAWTAVLLYAANPNLLYMQATAMTESVFLATVIWSAVYFADFLAALGRRNIPAAASGLQRGGVALAASMLTRYDGWFLAAVASLMILVAVWRRPMALRKELAIPLAKFLLLIALVPMFWLAYNFGTYGNALEFANGPYSARAIAERTTEAGGPPHPGHHDLRTASAYFVKSVKLNTGSGWAQHALFLLAVAAAGLSVWLRKFRPALFLWAVWPFYALSIGYGGVPVFLPDWWPHSYYNVRYGLQLLPALAIGGALFFEFLRGVKISERVNRHITAGSVAAIVISYAALGAATPICLREARVNAVTRVALETALATELRKLPAESRLLMYTAHHSGAVQAAGVPFRRVINEGNFGLWPQALAAPAANADFVIAVEGDPVAEAVDKNKSGLEVVALVETPGNARVVLYRSQLRQ